MNRSYSASFLISLDLLFVAWLFSFSRPAEAAPSPSRTVLYIAPGGPVNAGKVVNFKAWVSESGAPVTHGSVLFCDAAAPYCSDIHILAQAQLRSSGTAEVNLIPPRGTHEIQAIFQGTTLAAASKSAIQNLETDGPHFNSTTVFNANGSAGDYTLTGTVTSVGSPLSGTLDFFDATNSDKLLAEAMLAPAVTTFVPLSPTLPSGNSFAVTADLNGDGRLDQAVISSGNVEILLGKGDGTFTAGTTIPTDGTSAILVGDFNGDDLPDLLVANVSNSTLSVLLGNGDGTFLPGVPVASTTQYPEVEVIGDFNRDGNADIAVSYAYSGVETFLGNGDGTFTPVPVSTVLGSFANQITVGDFNGDGKTDLVVADIGGGAPSLLLGNGDGTFAQGPAINITCDDACPGIVAADFNRDGKTDLAIADRGELDNYTGNLYIMLGNGNGTFTQGSTIGGWFFSSLGVGDVDGDGNPDVIMSNNGYPQVIAYLGQANGTFSDSDQIYASSTAYSFLSGDFNNDGKTDLLLNDPNTTALSEAQATATETGVAITGGVTGAQHIYAEYQGNKTHKKSMSTTVSLQPSTAP